MAFQPVAESVFGPGRAAAQWLMVGTNPEPFLGILPTGKTVSLHGADCITVEPSGIRSVRGYFDRNAFLSSWNGRWSCNPKQPVHFSSGSPAGSPQARTEAPSA
ncbi:MAG: ester cyclase [Firmicutes bacterium]|nr:ester cyclase [Alicyclobacillaceae bacterium]MCL6498259.1 ester cyclase [Bacillota bacterium]